jgi:hypothetical protein
MPDATVIGKAADGAAVSGNPVLIAGQDGTNVQSLKTDASGELQVDVLTMPTVTETSASAIKTSVELIDDTVATDGAATPTKGLLIAGQDGTNAQTIKTDTNGELQVDVLTMPSTAVTNAGTFATQPGPSTTGGLLIHRSIDLDETEEEVKATAGQVYGWFIANLATSTRFVRFYNDTAANVIVGTTAPAMTLPIPGNSSDDVAANALGGHGITFGTAICVAATTGVADNDTGAPGANEVVINVLYK